MCFACTHSYSDSDPYLFNPGPRWGRKILIVSGEFGSNYNIWWAREDREKPDDPVVFMRAEGFSIINCAGCEKPGAGEENDFLCYNCRH